MRCTGVRRVRAYAAALAYALRYQGRKRVHNADEIMSEIVAKRLVEHLERAGFVVMIKSADRRRQRARGGRSSRGRAGADLWRSKEAAGLAAHDLAA